MQVRDVSEYIVWDGHLVVVVRFDTRLALTRLT